MIVNITFEHHWGYRDLCFTKTFNLPMAPFFGLTILDEDLDGYHEMQIDIETHDYQDAFIMWRPQTETFEVTIRKNWGEFGVTQKHINETIKQFNDLNWVSLNSVVEVTEMLNWAKENGK